MTAEDLLASPLDNVRTELVRGHLIVREPARMQHGDVAARVLLAIGVHLSDERVRLARPEARGRVLAAETGFTLRRNPDTVRAPDVAYVSSERWPAIEPRGYPEFAPDLAVEVLSPAARAGRVLAKVADWLDAGTLLVWVIDPKRRIAQVYRADGSETTLAANESLSGEELIPGLTISLTDLFD